MLTSIVAYGTELCDEPNFYGTLLPMGLLIFAAHIDRINLRHI